MKINKRLWKSGTLQGVTNMYKTAGFSMMMDTVKRKDPTDLIPRGISENAVATVDGLKGLSNKQKALVASGLIAGAGGVGAGAYVYNKKKKEKAEKVAYYKEEIFEKVASTKALAREALKSNVQRNNTPKDPGDGPFGVNMGSDNFRKGSKVRTHIRPQFGEGDHIHYMSTAVGGGRRNQQIDAMNVDGDIPLDHRKNESEQDYRARRADNVKSAKRKGKATALSSIPLGLGVGAGVTMLAGKDNIGTMLPFGATAGAVAAAIPLSLSSSVAKRSYMKKLKAHELKAIINKRDEHADSLSQHSSNADVQRYTNTHYY